MKKVTFLLLLALVNKAIEAENRVKRVVGGSIANYPPFDDPVVYVRFNGKNAKVQGIREFPHYVFKGIKYAHPPTGADRFLRPKEKFLEGEVRATIFAPPCIQPVPGKNFVIGTEDCLALNIFTPDLPTGTEGLPVIIWIHGGGFRYGSASQYGVRHLVGQRLVIVTIQYRLGSLGFLSAGTKHLPGNAALWDMALAVQWVRNYIGFFGGNPHRIVVMGHDTGASSAVLLALTKIAKGTPNAVVAMSGTAVSRWAIDKTPKDTARLIAEENGCPTGNPVIMVKCLQKISAESIINQDSNIEFQELQSKGFISGLNGRLNAAPVAEGIDDGRSLPGLVQNDPLESLNNQENPKIPLLTGVTKDETRRAVLGHFKPDVLKELNRIPNFLNKVLIERLQVTGLRNLGNTTGNILSNTLNFENYLKTPNKNDLNENLNKISDATADALFNLPAFLTAELWKGAPTFLYSFDHSGKMPKADQFLKGFTLIGNYSSNDKSNFVSHGDELAYLFDPQDLEGNPVTLDESPTEDDLKVQKIFVKMIADFARHGEITVDNRKVSAFNEGENNFVQIKPQPILGNKFKFCEMALWSRLGERLKSGYCQFFDALKSPTDVLGLKNVPIPVLPNTKNLGSSATLGIFGKKNILTGK